MAHSAKPPQMIARFTAVIVNNRLHAMQLRNQPRWRRRQVERPIRRRENVRNIGVPKLPPEQCQVDRFPNYCAEEWNMLEPRERARKRWIDRNKSGFHSWIILPMPQKQLSLNGLSAHIARRSPNQSNPYPPRPILGKLVVSLTREPKLLLQHFAIKLLIALAHMLQGE